MTRPAVRRDDAARIDAATGFDVNLVVSAGAGTGKTSLLVERALNAIGSGVAELPRIAAITFTDKAAGELRHKLASGLDELIARAQRRAVASERTSAARAFAHLTACGVDPPTIENRAAAAIEELDRAAISTIHGFCAELLRAHPLESSTPPGFVAEPGKAVRRLAEPMWEAFIGRELGPDGRRRELWSRALQAITLTDAFSIAFALASGAVSDAALAGDVEAVDLRAALGGTATAWAGELRAAIATPGLTKTPATWFARAAAALDALATEGTAAARRAIAASDRPLTKKPGVRTTKVADADADALEALVGRVMPLLDGLASLDERTVADVLAAVVPFARDLRAERLRGGLLDYDALLVRVRDLLRDDGPVRESVKRRFRMILLDEFQDTDPIQYEIVFFAAEVEGGTARNAFEARLAPGRLFIVGDAKQSIYRFRGADYAAYRRAVARVLAEGGRELTLSTNFRSIAAVLAPVNELFTGPGSAWTPSPYLSPYEPIEADRSEAATAPAVEVWTPATGGTARAAERRRAEGQAIGAEIAAIAGPGREFAYGDVLILLRGFSEVATYLRGLREAGVPFVVSGGRTFFARTEIVQTMAVLRAVADPDDEVAFLAYLRSPAGGVSDVELSAHARARGAWRADAEVDATACPALAAACARLAALRADASGRPVDEQVARIVRSSGLYILSGLAFEAAQRVANLEKLVLTANALARDGRLTLQETLDALEQGLELEDEGDSPLADETVDAVRVMTIHKAKGLEARLVILADAAADRSHQPPATWAASMASLGNGSFLRLDGPGFRNGASLAASLENESHERAEHVRLLYVALTRAKDRLIVLGGSGRTSAWIEALGTWGYRGDAPPADGALLAGGKVRHRVVAAPTRAGTASGAPVDTAPEAVARYEAAVAAVAAHAAGGFTSPSRTDDRAAGAWDEDEGEGAPRAELAREVGTIVHARLAGMPAADGSEAALLEADALLAAFARTAAGERAKTLDVVGREVPVLFDDDTHRWRGTIDLLYRDVDGTLVVADYKTDASSERAIERHGGQLDVYVRAVERAVPGTKVRGELWMLRTGDVLRK